MLDKKLLSKNIILALGLEKLEDEKKMALVAKLSDVVEKRILAHALETLSQAEKNQLDQFIDSDSLATFILSKLENLEAIINEEIQKVTAESLAEIKADQNI